MKHRRRIAIVVFALGLTVFGLERFWSGWKYGRSKTTCKQNLKAIGVALHSYHDSNAHFPAAYSSSLPPHSWRVALLPWLDQQPLFEQYTTTEAWNSKTNSPLLQARPLVYACPEVSEPSLTSYQAAVSSRTPWPWDTPSRFQDFTDGSSNTLMLFDVHDPEVEWTRPKDLTLQQATDAVRNGQRHHTGSERTGIQVLLADGSARYISRNISPEILHSLLTPSRGRSLPTDRLSQESLARASEEVSIREPAAFHDPIDCTQLPSTQLSPSSNADLREGLTVAYCPTMVLAWKRYIQVMPQLSQTAMATELLNNPFGETDIEASALEIQLTTAANFGPKVSCRLKKHLAFASEFDAFKLPLTFFGSKGGHKVRAFGVTSHWYEWRAALDQIRVIDYRSPDDFVIAIENLSGEDLVLAKIPKPETLKGGLDDITHRFHSTRLPLASRSVVAEEEVVIPVLELSVSAEFEEDLNSPDQPSGSRVESAKQTVQFRLDERGAVVWSEAEVIGENGSYDYTPGTRKFIFDKPFLIMLREAPEKQPYFAAWIGNTDLLIPNGTE